MVSSKLVGWYTHYCFLAYSFGPADESKRTKRVQGWSRLYWLGGILIIVSWHIHFQRDETRPGMVSSKLVGWYTHYCFLAYSSGPADESKRTKRVQGWSRLNWLGGILIIVSWHIHFNKLLMPLTPVCCFAN